MKRICAFAVVLLVLCVQVSVFADELTPENPTAGVTVTFDASPRYVVHIPASASYDIVNGNDLPVTADISYLPGDMNLVVRVEGLSEGGLRMTSGENSFTIPVTLGGSPCQPGSVIARFFATGESDPSVGTLRLEPGAKAPGTGSYSSRLTFSAGVE